MFWMIIYAFKFETTEASAGASAESYRWYFTNNRNSKLFDVFRSVRPLESHTQKRQYPNQKKTSKELRHMLEPLQRARVDHTSEYKGACPFFHVI